MERQYNAKRAAIELKRSEVMRLSQDFESKMRQKEVRPRGRIKMWCIDYKSCYFKRKLFTFAHLNV